MRSKLKKKKKAIKNLSLKKIKETETCSKVTQKFYDKKHPKWIVNLDLIKEKASVSIVKRRELTEIDI